MKTADGYPVVCYGVKIYIASAAVVPYTVNTIRVPKSHATGFMGYTCWAEENARSLNKKLSQYQNSEKVCEKGFHACPYPLDVFGYYAPAGSRFCEVEQSGKIDDSESDKVCSSKIRIGAELDIRGLVKAAVSYVKEQCTNECNAEPGKPATARGKASTGSNGLSVARGNNVQVKGGIGAILVIAEERDDTYDIVDWKAVVVDGDVVKADTWYRLKNGELVEVD